MVLTLIFLKELAFAAEVWLVPQLPLVFAQQPQLAACLPAWSFPVLLGGKRMEGFTGRTTGHCMGTAVGSTPPFHTKSQGFFAGCTPLSYGLFFGPSTSIGCFCQAVDVKCESVNHKVCLGLWLWSVCQKPQVMDEGMVSALRNAFQIRKKLSTHMALPNTK